MPDYQAGKIYKIESLIGGCIYYGSTTNKYLSTRMTKHRSHYKTGKIITSSKVLQYDDAKIILVESYPCNDKNELVSRECYYIKNNECVNKQIPGRTNKLYREDNKEKIKLRQSKPYTCQCGSNIRWREKSSHFKSKKHLKFVNNLI